MAKRTQHSFNPAEESPLSSSATFTTFSTAVITDVPLNHHLPSSLLLSPWEKELEMLKSMKDGNQNLEETEIESNETSTGGFSKFLENNKMTLDTQEKISTISTDNVHSLIFRERIWLCGCSNMRELRLRSPQMLNQVL